MKRDPDLTPLPVWRQRVAQVRSWWYRSRNQRLGACKNLKKAGRRGLTLAISVLGLTLVSYGAYSIYAPAGYIIGGLLLWIIQWNYGPERGSDR